MKCGQCEKIPQLCCLVRPKHQCHACMSKFCTTCIDLNIPSSSPGWNVLTTDEDGRLVWFDIDYFMGLSEVDRGNQ